MEISLVNAAEVNTSEQNSLVSDPAPPPSLTLPEEKVLVSVEVCLKPSSTARIDDVRLSVERMLEKRSMSYVDGPIPVPIDDLFLAENVQHICVCDTGCEFVFEDPRNGRGRKQSDEVESLAAARKAALSGSEPSDSIRVVNALLTQLDKLKSAPNVIILTTSNITAAIDIAFVDRADIKAYVGPPTLQARYEILRSCLQELLRTGILSNSQDGGHLVLPNFASLKDNLSKVVSAESQMSAHLCKQLLEAAEACEGMSGRSLRKLPFLAHASLADPYSCEPGNFLHVMMQTAKRERSVLSE